MTTHLFQYPYCECNSLSRRITKYLCTQHVLTLLYLFLLQWYPWRSVCRPPEHQHFLPGWWDDQAGAAGLAGPQPGHGDQRSDRSDHAQAARHAAPLAAEHVYRAAEAAAAADEQSHAGAAVGPPSARRARVQPARAARRARRGRRPPPRRGERQQRGGQHAGRLPEFVIIKPPGTILVLCVIPQPDCLLKKDLWADPWTEGGSTTKGDPFYVPSSFA